MLEEQMQQACSDAGQIADLPQHLISDQMKTPGFCPENKSLLIPHLLLPFKRRIFLSVQQVGER
jgi:hypothetical protein